jgi:hypothetical protein
MATGFRIVRQTVVHRDEQEPVLCERCPERDQRELGATAAAAPTGHEGGADSSDQRSLHPERSHAFEEHAHAGFGASHMNAASEHESVAIA